MKKILLVAALGIAGAMSALTPVAAQVAGSTTIGVAVTQLDRIALGWSAKKNILGKTVYDEAGEKIGKIDDLIIDLDKNVSYLIVGAGGFVGMGRHDVAVSTTLMHQQNGRIILPGATKESVRAMQRFDYALDTERHDRFVASAEKDIDKAKEKILQLQKKTESASAEVKSKVDREIVALKRDQKDVEDKLSAMKVAGAARWKEFEDQIGRATARLRESVQRASV